MAQRIVLILLDELRIRIQKRRVKMNGLKLQCECLISLGNLGLEYDILKQIDVNPLIINGS